MKNIIKSLIYKFHVFFSTLKQRGWLFAGLAFLSYCLYLIFSLDSFSSLINQLLDYITNKTKIEPDTEQNEDSKEKEVDSHNSYNEQPDNSDPKPSQGSSQQPILKWFLLAGSILAISGLFFLFKDSILPASVTDFLDKIPYMHKKVEDVSKTIDQFHSETETGIDNLHSDIKHLNSISNEVSSDITGFKDDVINLVDLTDTLVEESGSIKEIANQMNINAAHQVRGLQFLIQAILEANANQQENPTTNQESSSNSSLED